MNSLVVRRAELDDETAISDLAATAERLAMRASWGDVYQALGASSVSARPAGRKTYDLYLVEADGQVGCLWGSLVEPETVAQIRVFALHDDWAVYEALAALLPPIRRMLRDRGVTMLAYVGTEGWLVEGLATAGFRRANAIVTLQKTGYVVPDHGNCQVVVRPAVQADYAEILAIDQAAFEPLWRNTFDTLAVYSSCPYFVVAEWVGQVVGYGCASLVGRHGHLSRVAVHPRYQEQRIGVRLLAEAIGFFRRQRVFGVTVNTQQDNVRARRLYDWFGFKVLGREAEVLVYTV